MLRGMARGGAGEGGEDEEVEVLARRIVQQWRASGRRLDRA